MISMLIYTYIGGGLHVEMLTGETMSLPTAFSSTVDNVKTEIQNQTGIPSNLQQLRFNGRKLEDSYTLSDYELKYDSCLLVLMRYQG